jgi:hypothetical protein
MDEWARKTLCARLQILSPGNILQIRILQAWGGVMKKKSTFLFVAVLVLTFSLSQNLQAQEKQNYEFIFGFGAGLYAGNTGYDTDASAFFYKEFQVIADLGDFRAGLTFGGGSYSWHVNNLIGGNGDISFKPSAFLFHLAFFPFRLKSPDMPVKFYAGLCAGAGLGDLSPGFTVGPQLGLDFFLGKYLAFGVESRYIFISVDSNASNYFNFLFNLRFRIPFSPK